MVHGLFMVKHRIESIFVHRTGFRPGSQKMPQFSFQTGFLHSTQPDLSKHSPGKNPPRFPASQAAKTAPVIEVLLQTRFGPRS